MTSAADWLLSKVPSFDAPDVRAFVSAKGYYDQLAWLIGGTTADDLVIFSGWEFQVNQPFPKFPIKVVLEAAAQRRVRVRGLFDFDQQNLKAKHPKVTVGEMQVPLVPPRPDVEKLAESPLTSRGRVNATAAKTIIGMGGKAYVDFQQRLLGSHHQKLVFLTTQGRPHAFCGGIDIAYREAWRDVQCYIRGPATRAIRQTLAERWESVARQRSIRPIEQGGTLKNPPHVQIVRTYGKADPFATAMGRQYALHGEFNVHALLRHAIQRAHKYIYVEDQYFFLTKMRGLDHLGEILASRLAHIAELRLFVILARTEQINWEWHQAWRRRKELIATLTARIPTKSRVSILQYKPELTKDDAGRFSQWRNFVHSKVWIFDDECALIGSANFNRRGMSHDSEAGVAIAGGEFAKKLRIQMWLQHLNHSSGAKGGFSVADVDDWKKGWDVLRDSASSPFERYDANGGKFRAPDARLTYDQARGMWALRDPDGS